MINQVARRGFLGSLLALAASPFVPVNTPPKYLVGSVRWMRGVTGKLKFATCGNELTRKKLTDVYMSPEAMKDIRNWGVDHIDEQTRLEIMRDGAA